MYLGPLLWNTKFDLDEFIPYLKVNWLVGGTFYLLTKILSLNCLTKLYPHLEETNCSGHVTFHVCKIFDIFLSGLNMGYWGEISDSGLLLSTPTLQHYHTYLGGISLHKTKSKKTLIIAKIGNFNMVPAYWHIGLFCCEAFIIFWNPEICITNKTFWSRYEPFHQSF